MNGYSLVACVFMFLVAVVGTAHFLTGNLSLGAAYWLAFTGVWIGAFAGIQEEQDKVKTSLTPKGE